MANGCLLPIRRSGRAKVWRRDGGGPAGARVKCGHSTARRGPACRPAVRKREAVACAPCDDSFSGWPATAGSGDGSRGSGSPGEPSGGSCQAKTPRPRSRPASGSRWRAWDALHPPRREPDPDRGGGRGRGPLPDGAGPDPRAAPGRRGQREAHPARLRPRRRADLPARIAAWRRRPPRAASPSGSTWRGAPTRKRRLPSTSA